MPSYNVLKYRKYVHNELVHAKPAPLVDVSCKFLASYLASLQYIALDAETNSPKGKFSATTCFLLMAATCYNEVVIHVIPFPFPLVKLNTDGLVPNGIVGARKDYDGGIIFSSCRHLLSCDDVLP